MTKDKMQRMKNFDHAQILDEFKDIALLKEYSELICSCFQEEITPDEFRKALRNMSVHEDSINEALIIIEENIINKQNKDIGSE